MMMMMMMMIMTMIMLQWCVNGRCESTSKNIGRTDSLQHNSEAGGWSSWSRWGQCSRTCGAGAAFRTRRCNNPRPSYGGAPCRGNSEEFRLCNIFRSVLSPQFSPGIKYLITIPASVRMCLLDAWGESVSVIQSSPGVSTEETSEPSSVAQSFISRHCRRTKRKPDRFGSPLNMRTISSNVSWPATTES